MVVVHDALRREFAALPGLVSAVAPGDTARTQVVADHIHLLFTLLHHHHEGEDRVLWPVLLTRVPAEMVPVVEPMERQHGAIHAALQESTRLLDSWRGDASGTDRDLLAASLDELGTLLGEHLADEEQHVLPLAGRHLSTAEWRRLGEEGMAGVPKRQLPLVLGMLMQVGDPEVVDAMVAELPRPLRLVVPRLAVRAHRRYTRRVHGG
jgi:hemerythrin-like domain-containing protein